MWLSSILTSLSPSSSLARTGRRPSPRQRPTGRRLTLEALEDRLLLSYTFTPIADTSPGSLYSGLDRPAINDLGATAFTANLRSGGAGIFTRNADGSPGPIIAVTNDLLRTFTLSPFMNDSGTVSFGAELRDGRTAIFTGRGQELARIADTEPESDYSSLPAPAARIQSDGTVTFHGTLRRSGDMGLFVSNGGLSSTLYVTGGQFSAFLGGPASQVNGHTLAFRATLPDGTSGEFTGDGGPPTTVAATGPVFRSFIGGEINDAGTVAISANLTRGGQAIVVAQGGSLTRFVDTTGAYSQFFAGQVSINNDGQIVFGADLRTGGHGIFQGPDPAADKILATGDNLFGSTVVGFPTNGLGVRGLNNAGQIAFSANLADGRTVLVLADPVPETVESFLNDGAAQRSMVNRLTVTFSGAATLDPGAIELRRQDGSLVDLHADVSILGGKTVTVLTFVGSEFVGGSLADGSYTLTVRADLVHDRWGRELDGDGNGSAGGDRVDSFFRLFGDSDGDGHVDRLDRDLFRSAFKKSAGQTGYLWSLDFDGDGDVDGRDNGQFNRRFGQE
jgi:hypothetical protein